MKEKPGMTVAEMAMYVDNNIHSPNQDTQKIYDYLTEIAYRLAVKRRLFSDEHYYNWFAKYFARIVYLRTIKADGPQYTKRKVGNESITIELSPNDKGFRKPIKSCLNYMAKTIILKKGCFIREELKNSQDGAMHITDAEKHNACIGYTYHSVIDTTNDFLISDIESCLNTVDKIVKDVIKSGYYGNDPVLSWKLYTSVMLSLLRNLTISYKNKNKLNFYLSKTTPLEETMSDILCDETSSAPVVYDLDDEYIEYVAFLLQKVKIEITNNLKEVLHEYALSDEVVQDILMAELDNPEGD